jgi:Tol biopolymer transport system component
VRARVWQASDSGGTSPQWSPDGRELFYCDGRGIVSLRTARGAGGAPLGTERHRLFDAAPFTGRLGPVYSVSPDGQRFLFIEERPERESAAARRQLRLVQNWTTELAARLAQPPTATR